MSKKPQKLISEMTTRELKKYIKKEVKKANTKIRNIEKRKKGPTRAVQEELDYLKQIGVIGKRGRAVTGYRTASKAELQKKAKELTYFNKWKGSETVAVAKDKDYKKYQSFINNPRNSDFANYSYQQWRDMVEMFGAMDDKLKDFDYENMKQLHLEATNKDTKIDILSAMQNAQREADKSNRVVTTETLTDIVRDLIFQ